MRLHLRLPGLARLSQNGRWIEPALTQLPAQPLAFRPQRLKLGAVI